MGEYKKDLSNVQNSLDKWIQDGYRKHAPELYDRILDDRSYFDTAEEDEIKKKAEKIKTKNNSLFEIPDHIINSTPGLCGEISSWITATAHAPQPALSLGATLAAMGVIKGHKVRSDTDIRTNLFCLGIADAGSGKDHTLEFSKKLLEDCGFEDLVASPPTAGSSIAPMLKERHGKGFITWDEIGHSLEYSLNKRAASYEKSIISELLTVYSSASSSYRSKEYTNKKLNETIIVNQPLLGIWGVTTPSKFYDVITTANASDGFLPRWLMFPITDPDAENKDAKICDDVPNHFKNEIYKIKMMPSNVSPMGDIDLKIKPKVIEFNSQAKDIVEDVKVVLKGEKIKERERGTGLDAIWSRAWVHVVKCALIVSDGDEIGYRELDWAYQLVDCILKGSCKAFVTNSFETESGKEIDRILQRIKKVPGISLTDALRFSHLKAKDFHPILNTLIESGRVKVVEDVALMGKTVRRLYCIKD